MIKFNSLLKIDKDILFAFKVTAIYSPLLTEKTRDEHWRERYKRELDFINSLLNSGDERFTYEIRNIFIPGKSIDINFVVKINNISGEEAENYRIDFLNSIIIYLEEYKFEELKETDIKSILNPFDCKFVNETTRRIENTLLDSFKKSEVPSGFGFKEKTRTEKKISNPSSIITYLYPFIFTNSASDRLFRLAVLDDSPLLISTVFRPTTLSPAQVDFFEAQISNCEKYSQISLSSINKKEDNLFPTLRDRASVFQRQFSKMLYGLRDNSAFVQTRLASPTPISITVQETYNSIITEHSGALKEESSDSYSVYLQGGYNSINLTGKTLTENIVSLNKVEFSFNQNSLLNSDLKSLPYLFDTAESICLFRLPFFNGDDVPFVKLLKSKTKAAPSTINTDDAVVLGKAKVGNSNKIVGISYEDRRRHVYTVGQTGTGKTTLLKTMLMSDIKNNKGVCLIDPHGDLFYDILNNIPASRKNDVVIINPVETNFPVGINILEYKDERQKHFVVQEFISIFNKLLYDEYGNESSSFTGPIFYQHMRMNLLLAMSNDKDPGTLQEFQLIFQVPDYWKRWLPLKKPDPMLVNWIKTIEDLDYSKRYSDGTSYGGYLSSKFENFLFDPMVRNIFAQKHSTIDFRDIMDNERILLINLAKGELTETNSKFLGMFLLAKLQSEALERLELPVKERKDFTIYVDEFQNISTQNFISLLSEGRKFGINLVLANQFTSQIPKNILASILGNVGTMICFRLGIIDAEMLEEKFLPVFNKYDMANLPNWTALISTLNKNQIISPFTLETINDVNGRDKKVAQEIINLSNKKYGKSVKEVEEIIQKSFAPFPSED
jgi:hypothetical protein